MVAGQLPAARHVVGHQADIVEHGSDRRKVDRFEAPFAARRGDAQQIAAATGDAVEFLTQQAEQLGVPRPLLPDAVHGGEFPVDVHAVKAALVHGLRDLAREGAAHRRRLRRAGEAALPSAAKAEHEPKLGVHPAQDRQQGKILLVGKGQAAAVDVAEGVKQDIEPQQVLYGHDAEALMGTVGG